MITESDIKTSLYSFISASALKDEVSGTVTKRPYIRPERSMKEDVTISVLAMSCGQYQEAFANVNVYVPFSAVNGEEDSKRVSELSALSSSLFGSIQIGGTRFSLDSQHVETMADAGCSVINNKILVQQANY